MKLDEIKDEHMKNINSIDVKISAIISNKPSSYSEQLTDDLVKCLLLKSPYKSSNASHFTKTIPPLTLKDIVYLKFKNGGMPLYPHFYNTYQQTTAGKHTNRSKIKTTIYHNLFPTEK